MTDSFPHSVDFAPVPVTPRRDGWTAARQRAFIDALAQIGQVAAAVRHVGMTEKSAYRLRARADAASFAEAWDIAVEAGQHNVLDSAIQRALHGEMQPVYRQGLHIGWKRRYNDRLLIEVLKRTPPFRAPMPAISRRNRHGD